MGEDDRTRDLRRAAEALLLVTEEPLVPELMAQLLEIPTARVEDLCNELAAEYDATDRGFQLVKVAGGWRYQTHPDLAPYVERFVLEGLEHVGARRPGIRRRIRRSHGLTGTMAA